MNNTKLEAALKLASHNFRVFPLVENRKVPISAMTEFSKKATTDEEQIRKWFTGKNYNIGIYTGGLLALDVDAKDEKKNGIKSITDLNKAGKVLPPTTQQVTTTKGLHLIYNTPHPVPNSVSKIAPGLDIRGEGGYLVGAGSVIDGKEYTIDLRAIEMAPDWLVEKAGLATENKPRAREKAAVVDQGKAKVRALKYLNSLETITAGERNHAAYKVAAHIKDIGATQTECLFLMAEDWKCEPMLDSDELEAVVRSAYTYGRNPEGSISPEAQFGLEESEEDLLPDEGNPITNLNNDYAFIIIKGKQYILFETTDAKGNAMTDYMDMTSFHNKNAARTIFINEKTRPVTQLWLKDPRRRSYDGLVFAPEQKVDPRFYNLWRGFGVKDLEEGEIPTPAMERAVEMFCEHVYENACMKDQELYTWVISWLAHIIQKPWEKPGTALVLRGKKGVGKNKIFECIQPLFPQNYALASNSRYLTGQFNGHLENLLLFVADEAFWSGDKSAEGPLKSLITGPDIMIERKGMEPYSVDSRVRVVIMGNEDWLVPSTHDERRFAVLDVGEGRLQDRAYFKELTDCMNNGGHRYLFNFLKNFKITVDVGQIPQTAGLLEQKTRSLTSIEQWWFNCLAQGYISGDGCYTDGGWERDIDKEDLRSACFNSLDQRGFSKYKPDDISFFKTLKNLCPDIKEGRNERGLVKYVLPSIERARTLWEQFIGHEINWGNNAHETKPLD